MMQKILGLKENCVYMYIHIHNVYNFQNFQIYLFFPCAFFQREVDQVLKTWAQRFALVLASLRPNVLHEHWMLVYNMPWVTEGMCFYNELHRQPTWAPNSFWAPNYQEISIQAGRGFDKVQHSPLMLSACKI